VGQLGDDGLSSGSICGSRVQGGGRGSGRQAASSQSQSYHSGKEFDNIEVHAHRDSFPFVFRQSGWSELQENYDKSIIKRGTTFICSPTNQALPGGSLSGIIENKSYLLIR
jgi:hypothetical protein